MGATSHCGDLSWPLLTDLHPRIRPGSLLIETTLHFPRRSRTSSRRSHPVPVDPRNVRFGRPDHAGNPRQSPLSSERPRPACQLPPVGRAECVILREASDPSAQGAVLQGFYGSDGTRTCRRCFPRGDGPGPRAPFSRPRPLRVRHVQVFQARQPGRLPLRETLQEVGDTVPPRRGSTKSFGFLGTWLVSVLSGNDAER